LVATHRKVGRIGRDVFSVGTSSIADGAQSR
jgi:hypothetical protein